MTTFDALQILGLRWPRSGKMSCPLHKDKTPSLQLYQDSYYCFSCSATGDAYGLIAILTGQHINEVLREHGSRSKQRASSATLKLVGPQAMEAMVYRAWQDTNRVVYRRLHEVFGDFQTEVLLDEIERMGVRLDRLLSFLLCRDEWEEQPRPAVRDGLDAISQAEVEALAYLDGREAKLWGSSRLTEGTSFG
jgi:hypothetical protein